MWNRLKGVFADKAAFNVLVFMILVGFNLYAFRNYMVQGTLSRDYIFGGDGMAHAHKVAELVDRIRQGAYVDWSDAWYLGYHPYHFYPPLSYGLYAIIAYLLGDFGLGIRIGIASSFLISSLATYLVAIEIACGFKLRKIFSYLVAIVASIYFAYHPYLVNFITFVNDLPAAFAFSFLPVSFYFYLRSRHYRNIISYACCAFFLAGAFLAHAYVGFFAAIGIGLHSILEILLQRTNVMKRFASLLSIGLFSLGLAAFWVIPYYYEQGALASTRGYEWSIPIASVKLEDLFNPSMKVGFAPTYLGMLAIFILAIALVNRLHITKNLTYLLMLVISCYMALGVNAPLSWLNPLVSLGVFPDRMMVLCVFCLACSLASASGSLFEKFADMKFSPQYRFLAIGLCILVMVFTVVDSSSISPLINLADPVSSFNDVCGYIKEQGSGDGRVLFIGPDAPLYSHSPALTSRAIVGGYYVQGSKLSYPIEYCRTFALLQNETTRVLSMFKLFNVEYVTVDRSFVQRVASLLGLNVLQTVYVNEGYIVYKYLGYKGVIQQSVSDILVIGETYPSSIVKNILETRPFNITITTSDSSYIDDYSLDELLSHYALVLYSFTHYNKDAAESLLRSYAESGKLLIVDIDGYRISGELQNEGTFLGVHFAREIIYDGPEMDRWGSPFRVTYSALPINGSFSEGAYLSSAWTAMTYQGFSQTLLEVNEIYKAVGFRDNVYFVGLNLFYHALLYNNSAEIELLQSLCIPKGVTEKGAISYHVISESPFQKEYMVRSDKTLDVLVSMAWSPHLYVTVNNKPAIVTEQDGIIKLKMPQGENHITITYVETPIHFASNGATVITIVSFGMVAARLYKKRSGRNSV